MRPPRLSRLQFEVGFWLLVTQVVIVLVALAWLGCALVGAA